MTSLESLLEAMDGTGSTDGWDIVTSYSEDQLNSFLSSKYEAGALVTEVQIDQESGNFFGSGVVQGSVNLGSPALQIIPNAYDLVTLKMPIEGGTLKATTSSGKSESVSLPSGSYTLSVQVPFKSIDGETGEMSGAGEIVEFTPGSVTSQHVTLSFAETSGSTFSVEPEGSNEILETVLPAIGAFFKKHVSAIDYTLVGCQNKKPPVGDTIFTPKSFVFATTSSGDTSALSLFIQTSESGNSPGAAMPSFEPGGEDVLPIPEGYSASLILSNSLIEKTFLEPQLQSLGFSVDFPKSAEGSTGIQAILSADQSVISEPESNNYIYGSNSYSGLSVSLNDYPVSLVVRNGQISASWTGKATSSWLQVTNIRGSHASYGEVDLTIDMQYDPQEITVGDQGVAFPALTFERSDFTVHTQGQSCSFWDRLDGCLETVPSFYSNDMKLEIPSVSVVLDGFDYFRETNLLAPGETIIDISGSVGLLTPHDFMVVGNIIPGTSGT